MQQLMTMYFMDTFGSKFFHSQSLTSEAYKLKIGFTSGMHDLPQARRLSCCWNFQETIRLIYKLKKKTQIRVFNDAVSL